jgi:hypothetical protein
MSAAGGELVRRLQGFLSLDGEFVESHVTPARLSTRADGTSQRGWSTRASPTERRTDEA